MVSQCHLLKGEKIARVQLKGALQIARGFFPMAFAAIDVAGVFEYFGIVGERAPGNGQLAAGALVVAEAVVIVISQGEVGFACIRLEAQSGLHGRVRQIEAARSVVVTLPIDFVVHSGQ